MGKDLGRQAKRADKSGAIDDRMAGCFMARVRVKAENFFAAGVLALRQKGKEGEEKRLFWFGGLGAKR